MNCKICSKELFDECEKKYGICKNDIERISDMMNLGMNLFRR